MFHLPRRLVIVLLALLLNLPSIAYASQSPDSPLPAATTPALVQPAQSLSEKVDQYLNRLNSIGLFSGSVLIARGGKILYEKGYGMADYDLGLPNTPQTKFRIASLTKQFTALAVLMLQEQGKLRVQDSICQYLADCPAAWRPITIYHLLTHTSGIPNVADFPNFLTLAKEPTTPGRLLDTLKDKPLDFAPGAAFYYDNSGYIVLANLIERITGQPYPRFLRDHIFAPLAMSNTGMETSGRDNLTLKNWATGYYVMARVKSDTMDMSNLYGAANLYSTVEDLYRWDQALYTQQLVSQWSLNEMFTPRVPMWTNAPWLYGYGWIISQQFNRRHIFHAGWVSGYRSYIDRYPDDGVTLIVLSNLERSAPNSMAHTIGAMIFEGK